MIFITGDLLSAAGDSVFQHDFFVYFWYKVSYGLGSCVSWILLGTFFAQVVYFMHFPSGTRFAFFSQFLIVCHSNV